jgi:hypothetical protein
MTIVFHRSVPLGLVTASADGQSLTDNTALLETREAEFKLDTTKPFKINAETNGVCGSFHLPCHNAGLRLVHRPSAILSYSPRSYSE